ncbi:MAG: PEP-CTERM/exosortase system-associated acyltransferase [Burkholderiaceae bacterium]|nr:PEP-CTERM/exosortase system-associated acyltransferase [Burkholderiaceae bacterium]
MLYPILPHALGPTRLTSRFGGDFFDRFSLELATSDELRTESYRLRHRIYVEELKYERAEDFPHGVEFDAYDRRSLAVLLRHRASRRFIGCVRLIIADPKDASRPFPFELAAVDGIARSATFRDTPRECIGEVSRLAVIREFRRRKVDRDPALYSLQDLTLDPSDPRRHNNLPPALGLIFSAAWLGIEIGLDAVFVIMELRLARLLRSLGLVFTQVAEPIEYRGLRAPFEIRREALLGDLAPPLRGVLNLVRERMLALTSVEVANARISVEH